MVPSQSADLPRHPLFYSLLNLLAGRGGQVGMWFTPDQTYFELVKEYRKQAELAVRRGDFRRAAFIYAKLLNDYHSAATVLAQGGLHRDAAVLYEQKLQAHLSAAREWEAAGEFDLALEIYRKLGDHAAAGDLLRRIGEEDRAVKEYQSAAAKMVETESKYYEAGELLRVRAERPDLAMPYYENGWKDRANGSALLCVTRIVQAQAAAGKTAPFLAMVDEAAAFLETSDAENTARFFTEIARLAGTPPMQPSADEARGRALMGIARKMKQTAGTLPGSLLRLANMLKDPSVWPVPLVGDAQHALANATRRPPHAG